MQSVISGAEWRGEIYILKKGATHGLELSNRSIVSHACDMRCLKLFETLWDIIVQLDDLGE